MSSASAIREAALTMERIDTHAHLNDPYPDLREGVEQYESFATVSPLIDSRVKAEGCRVLYDIDPGAFVRPDAPAELFDAATELRAKGSWQAAVPHDRICWGSDSGTPESIAGIDSIMRKLIADVLEASVGEGTIDERYALEFIENAYQKTPARVFGLT